MMMEWMPIETAPERAKELDQIADSQDYEDDDDSECKRCHGDGYDPWNDYLFPCPVCGGPDAP